jgi:hypothetical protein
MNDHCEVEWTPPPPLDTGQARLNYYHRPERLLNPADDPDVSGEPVVPTDPADANDIGDTELNAELAADVEETGHVTAAASVADEVHEAVRWEQATTSLADVDGTDPAEPGSPTTSADNTGEPGGPAPPEGRAA